jgi:LPXTG-site transpeptidase (sortase) family protein
MQRRSSRIVVALGIASIAVLMIAGLAFHERPTGTGASPRDADETDTAAQVVPSPTSGSIIHSEPSHPTAASAPPSVRTTVAGSPTSSIVAQAGPTPVPTSPPPTDLVVVEVPASAPPTTEYVLDIQSIDLHEPVVAGDQDEIDQGHVTAVDWSAEGYPTSCRPGDGCTVWLAGHRSTHQAVFARVPEIAPGSPIEIHFAGRTYAYTVTDVVTVPGSSPPSVIHGDLVLQTSAPGGQRILVYAATVSPP